MVGTTPPTLAPVRLHVYQTVQNMATVSACSKSNVATTLLPALQAWWNKETKPEGKRACLAAALAWLDTEESVADGKLTTFWTTITSKATDAGLVLQQVMATVGTPVIPALFKILAAQKGTTKAWQALVETAQAKKAVQHDVDHSRTRRRNRSSEKATF